MEYKWKTFSVTSVGSLMSAIDSTIVLLALVPMAEELNSDYVTMVWVVVAYILANTALVLSLGRLADIYGRKKMYNVGFIVFILGSALCGFALSGPTLVGFRAIQGIGAALLGANSFAILSEAFPRNERGKAFGANSIVWGSGAVLGIVLGGLIITYTSWRLIFLINLPIGAFGTIWAYRTLKENKFDLKGRYIDLPATVSFTFGLLALMFGVTWGIIYSWVDPVALLSMALSPFILAFFVYWETKRSKDPVIDFALLKNRVFTLSLTTAMLQSLALFSVDFLLLFYLEGIAGLPVLTASYLIVPMAAALSLVGPFAGRLSDRFGARIIASLGLIIQVTVLFLLRGLTTTTPLVQVAIIEALYGVGAGLFWPANTSAIMASSPPARYGVSSGMMNTFRNTGMVMSFALALTAVTGVIPVNIVYELFIGTFSGTLAPNYASAYLSGQSYAFGISAVLLVVSTFFSLSRGKESRQPMAVMVAARIPAPVPLEAQLVEATGGHSVEPRQRGDMSVAAEIENPYVTEQPDETTNGSSAS
jgi:EmrB/QacA subfamily drug resistance transporter